MYWWRYLVLESTQMKILIHLYKLYFYLCVMKVFKYLIQKPPTRSYLT